MSDGREREVSPAGQPARTDSRPATYLAGADAAGVVVGVAVPIILASRADNVRTRIASAALASMVAARG